MIPFRHQGYLTYGNSGVPSSDILEKYEPDTFELYSNEGPSQYLEEQKDLLRLVYISEGLSAKSNYQEGDNAVSGVLIYEIIGS